MTSFIIIKDYFESFTNFINDIFLIYFYYNYNIESLTIRMINTQFLFRLALKLIVATYFLSHGINLSKKIPECSIIGIKNLQWIINSSTITIPPSYF